jgi:hypothetical protein
MTTRKARLFSLLLIGSLLMAGCGFGNATPNADLQKQITETMQAVATSAQETLQAAAPTAAPATETPVPTAAPTETSTPPPTDTPMPTEAPTATNTPAPVVPIYTAPPVPTRTPTPSGPVFSLSFYQLDVCSPNWVPAIKIVNTGSTSLSSYSITTKDRNNDTTLSTSSNDFSKRKNCAVTKEITTLDPGDTGFIYTNSLDYDPSGHNMKASVTVCVHNDLKGKCSSLVLNYKPK